MPEYLTARTLDVPMSSGSSTLLRDLERNIRSQLTPEETPVRLAVTQSDNNIWSCELGLYVGGRPLDSIFQFKRRSHENTKHLNVVFLVPTGIGAEIGGHAGDAGPAAILISALCDNLITHPNVLNASDLIQVPENVLYVEGSVITRMLMGTSRLLPVRSNRILVLVQSHEDRIFTEAAINAVNASRAYFGLHVTEIVTVDANFKMTGKFNGSGSATGSVIGLERIFSALDERIRGFDAVAISSMIEIPYELHKAYYELEGDIINPWGGIEAMLTHAISLKYTVPAAHSPMFESREVADLDVGIVDARMAAEVISLTFFQSVLRGLHQSPRIVGEDTGIYTGIGVEDISCVIIPDGCLGLPMLASLQQDIPVIAVRENSNIMKNDLAGLPWSSRQFIPVDNYWEAAGVVAALKAGLDPYSVRRPLARVPVTPTTREIIRNYVTADGISG